MQNKLTEKEKKELDHQVECQRKAILPNLNEQNKKSNKKSIKRTQSSV